ncbi:MAG: hypothetical protein J5809_03095 [Selenomonadaceae bacterium]|nr:hypothetical protein [Selenomonadaceae bacterium]
MVRWLIGGAVIFLCAALEIHGSSLGMYAEILGHPELSDVILGKVRPIRSDEWVVFTPFAFSQYFAGFSTVSEIIRAASTNVFLTYGQAALHPAVIFRPAQWGYLFFDQGSALAFFWTARLIVLLLVSYEFARLILQAEKKFSVLYAIMVAFSPLAQWWWSVNSVAEILAAGQGIVVCWKIYMNSGRLLAAAGFLWCAGIFIFGIYPAWQISFGYVFLFCLIAVTKNSALKFLRRDKTFWLAGAIIVLAPICHAVFSAREMIQLQLATEYPGQRFLAGGIIDVENLLIYGASAALPFADIEELTNNCEAACFYSMAPLGFLILAWQIFAEKKFDAVMVALAAAVIFLTTWELWEYPAWLAKATLLSKTTPTRTLAAIDFAQLAMVFRGLSVTEIKLPRPARTVLSVAIAALTTYCVWYFISEWLVPWRLILIFAFAAATVYLFVSFEIRRRLEILCAMMLVIGATVNPINSGVDAVYEMPVGKKIAEVVQREGKSLWIVEGKSVVLNDFPIMFGAPTINSVNVYPVLERWRKLNPAAEKIYNRYAHISVELSAAPTEFILNGDDYFTVKLNAADLPKLEARYIFSRDGALENFSTPRVKIQKIYEDAGSYIYEIH